MAMAERDSTFLGTGWGFPPEFGPRGARMADGEDDVREALRILLSTKPGERVMHPAYGCGLHQMVFEAVNESSVAEIKDVVERAVLFFEPRVTLVAVTVDTGDLDEGLLGIGLDYVIRTTNSRSNMVYPFYIAEGSNVVL
jgi:phage baseplate assembly protein W